MIIYIASDGQARLVSPQHVYQGSSVTDITVIAPFPAQTAMTVAFSLPDGKMFGGVQGAMQTPQYVMTLLANQPKLPDNVYAWQYVMTSAITQNAGQAKVSVTAHFTQGSGEATSFIQQTSAQVEFTIEPSTVGTLPDEPTEDAWSQVLAYMSAQDTKIAAIQGDIADIEQVVDEANTNAGTALANANEANTTAAQAKDTADGLADSIAQANVTASQAEQTAQEAKEIAEGAAQSNGTRVSVGEAFQQTLSFTSDPQTQITANKNAIAAAQSDIRDIVSGAQTVGRATTADSATNATNAANATKATQDASGNVIDTTYAKLSQVVRTDTVSSNTDEQKRVANENTLRYITGSPAIAGWYRVATLFGSGIYEINVSSTYNINAPVAIKFIVAVSTSSGYNVSITQIGGAPNLTVVTRARLNQDRDNLHFEIYVANPNNPIGVSYKAVTSLGSGLSVSNITPVAFTNIASPYNVLAEIGVVCGITTTGGVYQDGAPVFATDPSKLAPSTANGWTQTTTTGTLPSAGVYMIAFNHLPSDSAPGYYNPAILVYDGTIGSCTVTDDTGLLLISMVVEPSGIQLTNPVSLNPNINSTNIYYKRIA